MLETYVLRGLARIRQPSLGFQFRHVVKTILVEKRVQILKLKLWSYLNCFFKSWGIIQVHQVISRLLQVLCSVLRILRQSLFCHGEGKAASITTDSSLNTTPPRPPSHCVCVRGGYYWRETVPQGHLWCHFRFISDAPFGSGLGWTPLKSMWVNQKYTRPCGFCWPFPAFSFSNRVSMVTEGGKNGVGKPF